MNPTDSPAVARLRKNLRYASDFPSGHVDEVEAVLAELDRLRATVIALEAPQEARLSTESSSTGADGPAERLRRAADMVGQAAAKATSVNSRTGRWEPGVVSKLEDRCICLCCHEAWAWEIVQIDGPESPEGCTAPMHIGEHDARWIAMMGPQVAASLAAWLRLTADWYERERFTDGPPLDLTDAILDGAR